MHRVERVFADETAGEIESYAERFRSVVGADVRNYLESGTGAPPDDRVQ